MFLLKLQSPQELFVISRRKNYLITHFSGESFAHSYLSRLNQCKTTTSVKKIHAQIIFDGVEQNPFVASKLIGKYFECGDMDTEVARKVFDGLTHRDVLLWNVVIRGYANSGPFVEALYIYLRMRRTGMSPNRYTFPFVLKACGAMEDRNNGRVVHGQAVKSGLDFDLFAANALIAFYSKCRDIGSSRRVFKEMPQKDIVTWNAMISGNASNGFKSEALVLFSALVRGQTGFFPDHATLVATLPACTRTLSVQAGFWIHSYAVKSSLEIDRKLGSGLISMYANWGRVSFAREVFARCGDKKSVEVWTAMIRCYGMNGLAEEALDTFSKMLDRGLSPDGVTFLCVLSACGHAGLVKEGYDIFNKMENFGVEKQDKHYACVVDMFVRAGLTKRAIEFVEKMMVHPGKDVYGALLGACKAIGDIEFAKEVAEKLATVDPFGHRQYVTLANMYEEMGQWEDAARMRKELREKTMVTKPTGTSSIQVH